MPRLRLNFTITPVPPINHEPGYYVVTWTPNKFYGYMTRLDRDTIRRFKTRNGARKAIWRERNGEYHR